MSLRHPGCTHETPRVSSSYKGLVSKMSSSFKRAPARQTHDVKTTNSGKRYVDLTDVINSELERIERSKAGDRPLNGSAPSHNNGSTSRNGNNSSEEGTHT